MFNVRAFCPECVERAIRGNIQSADQ